MTLTRALSISAGVLVTAAFAMPASAADTREACRADAIHYCPNEVAARDRKAVRRCIRDNLDKVSAACRDAIAEQQSGTKPGTPPQPDGATPADR
jgi:hypothetical protein